jgi:Zn-finger nucleic acid-binding protein
MTEGKKRAGVFQIICPRCQSVLWVDGISQEIVKTEKHAAKKKGSLDELIEKEKKRQDEFERKFEATAELERQKKEKAKEAFERALSKLDKEE